MVGFLNVNRKSIGCKGYEKRLTLPGNTVFQEKKKKKDLFILFFFKVSL